MPFGVVSGVGPGIRVLDGIHVRQGEGAVSGMVSGIFGICACIGFNRRDDAEKCIRLVCEKLAVFPYARYIVEFCVIFPFL